VTYQTPSASYIEQFGISIFHCLILILESKTSSPFGQEKLHIHLFEMVFQRHIPTYFRGRGYQSLGNHYDEEIELTTNFRRVSVAKQITLTTGHSLLGFASWSDIVNPHVTAMNAW
jgi:hypothetical protein